MSSTTSSSYGSSMGSTGSSGSTGSTSGLQMSAGNNALQRTAAIQRDTSSLINSNYDVIGGQPGTNSNQFANLFSQIGRQMNQGGNFNQSATKVRPAVRVRLVPGFVSKPMSIPQFTARIQGVMAKVSNINSIGPIRVTMNGSTAVLQGVVASDQDRELAAGVALLEPEVESVQNDLTVQGASRSDVLTPPTTTP